MTKKVLRWSDYMQIKFRNTKCVREAAITFEDTDRYCPYDREDPAYRSYWRLQEHRSLFGDWFPIGPLGEEVYIPGYQYWYLNFCPIMKLRDSILNNKGELTDEFMDEIEIDPHGIISHMDYDSIRADRIDGFPDFYDGDIWHYKYMDEAERLGLFGVELKVRGVGSSFKAGGNATRNYFLIPKSKSFMIAENEAFLLGDGCLQKAWDIMGFVDEHTGFGKLRQYLNTVSKKRASYEKHLGDGLTVETGFMSEILGITTRNDPNKVRGIRGKYIHLEEAGKDPHLEAKWMILKESVKRTESAFGFLFAAGCVCAGTKVWDNNGNLVNIEDLQQLDGILGYNKVGISKEEITYMQEPKKKICYRITTHTGRYLECSSDHPILKCVRRYPKKKRAKHYRDSSVSNVREYRTQLLDTEFIRTNKLKLNDRIAIIEEVPLFGEKELWEPRLIGWLIGDGSYGFDKTPVLSNCEIEINDYIKKNFDTKIEKTYLTKELKIYQETRIKGICQELRKIGIYGQTKDRKTLPLGIHSYTKKTICELIGGLFDTDGTVSTNGQISITSMSFNLLNEIRMLCQKIGVHGTIMTKHPNKNNPKDKNDYYCFLIHDKKSVLAFSRNIKLLPYEKQRRLSLMEDFYKDKKERQTRFTQGLRYERIVKIEKLGFKDVYNLTANTTHTYIANGIVTHNTGGTEGADYEGLSKLYWNPKAYDIHYVPNMWMPGQENKAVGFFWPADVNAEKCMDEDGNSDREKRKKQILSKREDMMNEGASREALLRFMAEQPLNPMEATLNIKKSILPVEMLMEHLNDVSTDPLKMHYGRNGYLYRDDTGVVKFRESDKVSPLDRFPYDGNNKSGCIVIYDSPYTSDGYVPQGLYLLNNDPYYQDKSTGPSLGATYVYKKINNFHKFRQNTIVASYVGRPETLEQYLTNLFLLAEYYNARVCFENDKGRSITEYARRYKKLGMLQSEFEFNWSGNIKRPGIRRGYGYKMGSGKDDIVRVTAEQYLADWLIDEIFIDETGKSYLNLHTIYDKALLQEMIAYGEKGNYDRVDAILGLMLYIRETISKVPQKPEKLNEENFFSRERIANYFKHEIWYNQS